MKTISQLEDYHNEIENQRIQKALFEAACHESEVVYCFSLHLHYFLIYCWVLAFLSAYFYIIFC